ncbi:MAG: type IX secretion system outer membrane channel protein PorV [Bacteroidota bacterium]
MNRLLLCAALAVALAPLAVAPASAQDDGNVVITTAVPFLQIEPDSRAAGMGMTGVATTDNAYAPFWNPAGLAGQEGTEISLTYAPWLPALGADLSYNYVSGKHSMGSAGTLGGHFTYFNLGEQTWTDDQGTELGEFRSFELAAGLSYGVEVGNGLSIGAGGRFIYSSLVSGNILEDAQAGVSFGADLGVIYDAPQIDAGGIGVTPSLGFNLANMGPSITYLENGVPNAIPTNLRFGTGIEFEFDEFNKLTTALDLNKLIVSRDSSGEYEPFYQALFSSWGERIVDTSAGTAGACSDRAADEIPDNDCESVGVLRQLTLGAGLEYWYNDLLALRGGYFYEDPANGNREFLTFGAGIRYNVVGFDLSYIYALEENSPLADQLRFSVLLNVPR